MAAVIFPLQQNISQKKNKKKVLQEHEKRIPNVNSVVIKFECFVHRNELASEGELFSSWNVRIYKSFVDFLWKTLHRTENRTENIQPYSNPRKSLKDAVEHYVLLELLVVNERNDLFKIFRL